MIWCEEAKILKLAALSAEKGASCCTSRSFRMLLRIVGVSEGNKFSALNFCANPFLDVRALGHIYFADHPFCRPSVAQDSSTTKRFLKRGLQNMALRKRHVVNFRTRKVIFKRLLISIESLRTTESPSCSINNYLHYYTKCYLFKVTRLFSG